MTLLQYGKVTLDGRFWFVECEPFVRARLKRVFPRAPQHASQWIKISDTPENCRELLWFLDRYPMAVSSPLRLHTGAEEHRAQEWKVSQVTKAGYRAQAVELALPAREYQLLAADLLEVKGGLLVADDVGLGKTVTSICSMVKPGSLPALVVAPAHLPRQWAEMIGRFAPQLRVHLPTKGTPYPIKRVQRAGQLELLDGDLPDVLVMSYHKLRGWCESLAGQVQLVVFDECQQLRSPSSQIYQAAMHVAARARRRLGLSATPIYNYGSEFFWVLDALLPGALGQRDEFIREWCAGSFRAEKARISDPLEFGAYLRREGVMIRRTREEVGRELPELTKVIHTVAADPDALQKLKGDAVALAQIVVAHNERFRGEKMQAAGEFDAMMRQATGIAKAPYVTAFVRLLLESEEKVVLFGWHRHVYDIWLEHLKEFAPTLYTGTESAVQKAAALEDFKTGKSRVLIMSLRSGAGVDSLQGVCRTVVFGELDWSPGVHEQCVGRVHRDGQDQPCLAYFLVAEDGADPVMVDVLGIKREQSEGVRNPDRPLVEKADTGQNNIQRLAREFLAKKGRLTDSDS